MIRVENADIYWHSYAKKDRFAIYVCDRREIDLEKQSHKGLKLNDFMASSGAHVSGWNTKEHALSNPERVFGCIMRVPDECPSHTQFVALLSEFSKIDACEWAREMLFSMTPEETESAE